MPSDFDPTSSDPDRHPLDLLADEFAARCRKGERPSVNDYVSRHPELADQLREMLPPIALMERLKHRNLSGAADAAASAPMLLERVGDFQIIREIGRGGMGIVYEARQESLGRTVALKVLSRASLLDPQRVERFEREARAAAGLHHTNIVPVFGVGQADGLHYIAMQHIQGRTLGDVIREEGKDGRLPGDPTVLRRSSAAPGANGNGIGNKGSSGVDSPEASIGQIVQSGYVQPASANGSTASSTSHYGAGSSGSGKPASNIANGRASARIQAKRNGSPAGIPFGRSYWQWAAKVARQIADALDYAHRHGVVHRDIKPGNLLLDEAGDVWITDFGLAKLGESANNVTQAGDVIGTLQYLAPEGLKSQTDSRGDIYGLGATLYELLSLRPAYDAPSPAALMRKLAEGEPDRPRKHNPNIPPDLETIALKAMARLPENRYQTAGELAADLGNFIADRPIKARRASALELGWRWCRRNRAIASLGAIAATAALVAIAVGWTAYAVTNRALADEAMRRTEAESARRDAETARQRADQNVALSLTGFEDIFNAIAPVDGRPAPGPRDPRVRIAGRNGPGGRDGFGGPGGPGGPGGREGPGGLGNSAGGAAQEAAVLQSILNFYDRFSKQNPSNDPLRAEAAKAYRRVGDSYLAIGQSIDADAAFRRSAGIYLELIQAQPDVAAHRLGLAESVTWLSFESTPPIEADEALIHRAATYADGLVERLGPDADPKFDADDVETIALVLLRDGGCLQFAGQMTEAEHRFRRSVQAWSAFVPKGRSPDGRPRREDGPGEAGPDGRGPNGRPRFRPNDRYLALVALAEVIAAVGRSADFAEPANAAIIAVEDAHLRFEDEARVRAAMTRLATAATTIGDTDIATRATAKAQQQQLRRFPPGRGGPNGGGPDFDRPSAPPPRN